MAVGSLVGGSPSAGAIPARALASLQWERPHAAPREGQRALTPGLLPPAYRKGADPALPKTAAGGGAKGQSAACVARQRRARARAALGPWSPSLQGGVAGQLLARGPVRLAPPGQPSWEAPTLSLGHSHPSRPAAGSTCKLSASEEVSLPAPRVPPPARAPYAGATPGCDERRHRAATR